MVRGMNPSLLRAKAKVPKTIPTQENVKYLPAADPRCHSVIPAQNEMVIPSTANPMAGLITVLKGMKIPAKATNQSILVTKVKAMDVLGLLLRISKNQFTKRRPDAAELASEMVRSEALKRALAGQKNWNPSPSNVPRKVVSEITKMT